MQVTIISVGRIKNGPEKQQIDTYIKRCPWPVKIIEIEEKRPIKGAERMMREGELILKSLTQNGGDNAYVIALDERGKSMRSTEFAHMIQNHQDNGAAHMIFLIGGANGYAPEIKHRANSLLSLSDMTWPHMMARVMLTEQLYRASCILSGHPYHKD